MAAMEKVAWTELIVSAAAIAFVSILYPWAGENAHAGFAVLGLLVCGLWFVKKRGQAVVIDERDREIERQAKRQGIESAWMVTFLALIAIVFWSSLQNDGTVSTIWLTWLIWIQFAVCYGVKGLVGVLMYRSQRRAT